jgi:hypothetical protein
VCFSRAVQCELKSLTELGGVVVAPGG